MSKHTPGPWGISQNVSRHVVGPNGGVVASAELTWTADISEANARLIAAAPDLFGALANLLQLLPSGTTNPAIQAARQAIAKATGEQQ